MIKFFILLCAIVVICGCHKPCNEPDYNFSVFEAFSPERDSMNIRDTLFLNCEIPKMEKDINTGKVIDFSNLGNLGDNLVISDISKFRDAKREAADSFLYINIYGKIYSDNNGAKQFQFMETDSSYRLKVGLILLKSGSYVFTIPDAIGVYRNGHVKCGVGNYAVLNSNMKKHLYLFEDLWGPIISVYDKNRSYCIKVK
jgi:hypothetical protein